MTAFQAQAWQRQMLLETEAFENDLGAWGNQQALARMIPDSPLYQNRPVVFAASVSGRLPGNVLTEQCRAEGHVVSLRHLHG